MKDTEVSEALTMTMPLKPVEREFFGPQLIAKGQTRLTRLDGQILALYAKGMTTRDIADTLQELYGTEVSPALVAKVTEAVWETVHAWQQRPLETVYPILYLDGLVVKVHHENRVLNKALYVALGVNLAGRKEVWGCGWRKPKAPNFGCRC